MCNDNSNALSFPYIYIVGKNGLPPRLSLHSNLTQTWKGTSAETLKKVVDAIDGLRDSGLEPFDRIEVARYAPAGAGEMPASQRPLQATKLSRGMTVAI